MGTDGMNTTPADNQAQSSPSASSTQESDSDPSLEMSSPSIISEELIHLKIKDLFGITPIGGTRNLSVYWTATIADIFGDVCNHFKMSYGTFDLLYQDRKDSYELSAYPESMELSVVNIVPSREKEYTLIISSKKSGHRKKHKTAITNTTTPSTESVQNYSGDLTTSTYKREFSGLKNQHMTCYLNSVIQSLWFTPEFRNLIYCYEPKEVSHKSFAVPLQKLFLRLQITSREAIETEELTESFGWTSADTWRQHDAEEFCNILLENIADEFKGTSLDGVISALYTGSFTDYVKCLECDFRSERESPFQVLPLPIRQFVTKLPSPTLESALSTFVAPEVLTGDNQYNCSKCEKKCDAHKGLIFRRLSYILPIQLKRFEVDFETGRKMKLNDKVIFPMVLDMNPYMDPSSPSTSATFPTTLKPENQAPPPRDHHSRPTISMESVPTKSAEGLPEIGLNAPYESVRAYMEKIKKTCGPNVYELFSVLVHRGGITAGHYFAFIRDFETSKWYRCDDAFIRKADIADIEISYAGDSEEKETTTAYMLMYRRYDDKLNSLPLCKDEMSEVMRSRWDQLEGEEKTAYEEEELEKNTTKILAQYRLPGTLETKNMEVNVPKSYTTDDTAKLLYETFFPGSPIPSLNNLRVCRFDNELMIIENSFDELGEQYFTYAIKHPQAKTNQEGFLLEIKSDKDEFDKYDPGDYICIVQKLNVYTRQVVGVYEVHLRYDDTMLELIQKVEKLCHVENQSLFLYHADTRLQRLGLIGIDMFPDNFGDVTTGKIQLFYAVYLNLDDRIQNHIFFVEEVYNSIEIIVQIHCTMYAKQEEHNIIDWLKSGEKIIEISSCGDTIVSASMFDATREVPASTSTPKEHIEAQNTSASTSSNHENQIPDINTLDIKCRKNANVMLKFVEEVTNGVRISVRIDKSLTLAYLSRALSLILNAPEEQFLMIGATERAEAELIHMNSYCDVLKKVDFLYVQPGRRLNLGESRIYIFMLNLANADKMFEYIGTIILSPETEVETLKSAMINEFSERFRDVHPDRIVLRKKKENAPSKIFRNDTTLSYYFSTPNLTGAELCLQILEEPVVVDRDTFSIIIRQWSPSEWVLHPVKEFLIYYDHLEPLENILLAKIIEITHIPRDEVEVAKPDDEGFPHDLNPLAMDNLIWFPLNEPAKRSLYVYNDELFLFVRNKTETIKPWTPEEERQFRLTVTEIKAPAALSPAKREIGISFNSNTSLL